jgi:septum formation protein
MLAAMRSRRTLILASTSRYRQALLARLGVPFAIAAPHCDESALRHLPPAEQAMALAARKAESLTPEEVERAAQGGDPLIIGSDQVVALGDQVLEKPGSAAAAQGQLRLLRGRTHRLLTAVSVHEPRTGRTETDLDVHELTMRDLSDAVIEAYVAADQPLDCAGSYVLERRGVALFERIVADPAFADDTAIVGLPLGKLCGLLRTFGYDVLSDPPSSGAVM